MRFLATLFIFLVPALVHAEMPVRQLYISNHPVSVEVAHTQISRSQGLMFRRSLGENDGMLFVFLEPGRHSMWMMNTEIPLSVAFIDEKGMILNVEDMLPHTQTAHTSGGAAKYALEMNLGWFAKKNIKRGERVTGLQNVPPAE